MESRLKSSFAIYEEDQWTCRWCGETNTAAENSTEFRYVCKHCEATRYSSITFQLPSGPKFEVYHNPNNSLYVEFVKKDGKTARYIVDADVLRKTGALKEFDFNPEGKR